MQDPKMPDLLHGSDDAIIAENVKTLKNRGFDESEAIKLAQQYAQDMSDITKKASPLPGKPPRDLTMAAPSEKPVKEIDDETAEVTPDDEKGEGDY